MTLILKKQLSILGAVAVFGGALMWNSGALRAQDGGSRRVAGILAPRVPLSRDDAARNFAKLLQLIDAESRASSRVAEPDAAVLSSFSLKSERELGFGLIGFLTPMAQQWKQPRAAVKVQSESETSATVTVDDDEKPVTRPFVLLREGDSWGVDVLETYAQWNGLEGQAKTATIARLITQFNRPVEEARQSSCQSNLKQIALGITQYMQDYDEKLPPAKPWIDVLQPYLKSEQVFQCPAVADAKGYGYAFNSKLSGKLMRTLSSPAQTVSVYETGVLQRNAYGMGENLAFRHSGGANYAFTDGHVKWFDKTATPSFKLKP